MGPILNPRWEQKQTEGYVIVFSEVVYVWHSPNTLPTICTIRCSLLKPDTPYLSPGDALGSSVGLSAVNQ
jgi:hypothetical protein